LTQRESWRRRRNSSSHNGGDILGDAMSNSTTEVIETEGAAKSVERTTMDIVEIMAILPHRYPFLLIDRVIEMERKTRVVAIKNVTVNEPHFVGHFPDYPVMPAVLQIEAMAQAGGALLLTEFSLAEREEKLMMFTGVEAAKFRRPVTPGDQLRIEVTVLNWRTTMVKLKGAITVEGKLVSEATFTAALVPRVRVPKAEAEGA
jgi:3-hydroxyacyl-[acyl-carrier-protein] dehydratase